LGNRIGLAPSYSAQQIALHWIIAALVGIQLTVNDGIELAFDDRMNGDAARTDLWVAAHIVFGLTVLLLTVWRVALRLQRGAPPPPIDSPLVIRWLGNAAHLALYAFLFIMPLSGALAWFGQNDILSEIHEAASTILIPLILLHAAGALVEHFYFGSDVLMRMIKPRRPQIRIPKKGIHSRTSYR
jgi:cytochrome b561